MLGTQRVCAAARDAGVPRLVLLSSVRAFSDTGFPDGVTEEHPVRPDGNPYVDTKIASEHVVLSAHAAGEIESVIVRPGDVYGPGSVPWVLKPLDAIRSGQFLLPRRRSSLTSVANGRSGRRTATPGCSTARSSPPDWREDVLTSTRTPGRAR